MTVDLGRATISIGTNLVDLTSGIGTAKALVEGLGAVAVGAGVAATKMAGDFQAGMTSLVTGAGESEKNLKLVSEGVLTLSTQTGTATKQLIDGMYMIESAGFHGAAGLDVLKAAAEGAKVGSADLGVVADATTTILKDFGDTGINADQAVNALVTTVKSGKTHMQDLASSLSQILPTASAAKVSLQDVMGAMATMTGEGVPAANAATYLRQTLLALEAPSSKAEKALHSVGLTTAEVTSVMQDSLPDALKMITDAVGKKFPEGSAAYIQAIKDISGGSKTMQGMLDLTGQHLKDFNANVLQVGHDLYFGKDSIEGWNLVQDTFNQKMDRAKAVVEGLGISIGTALLPEVGTMVDMVSGAFTQMGDATQQQTLRMQVESITNTQAMAHTNIDVWQQQKETIITQMEQTRSGAVRKALETRLQTLSEWQQQAQGVIDAATKQKDGVTQQLAQIDPVVRVQQLTTKAAAIQTSLEQAQGVVDTYDRQRQDIEQQMLRTHDAVKRHALATKLEAITQAEEQANGVVKTYQKQQTDIAAQLTGAQKDANNPFAKLLAWVQGTALPELEKFGGWIIGTGIPAVEGLATKVEQNLLPPLDRFGGWLIGTGIPSFERLATTVEQNLLPPVLTLITNAESLATHIIEWANNSGTLKDVLVTTSEVLGTLVGWVGTFVGWLDQGNPLAWTLVGAVTAIGVAVAGVKLADWIFGWKSIGEQFKDLAGNLMPNFTKSLEQSRAKAVETKVAVAEVGTESKAVGAKDWFANLDASLDTMNAKATTASGDIKGIGTSAAVAEGEVASATATMETDISGVGTEAATTSAQVESVGTAAETTATTSKGAMLGMLPVIGQVFLAFTQLRDLLAGIKLPGGLTVDQAAGAMGQGTGFNPWPFGHAAGGMIAPGDIGLVGEHGPEFVYGGGQGASVTSTSDSAAILRGGGGSRQPAHFHFEINGREFAEATIDDINAVADRHVRLKFGQRARAA